MILFLRKVLFILFELVMIPFGTLLFIYELIAKLTKRIKFMDKFFNTLMIIEDKLQKF